MERFGLKTLNEVEGKEQCRVEVSNRFAALEDLDAEVQINSACEMIRKNNISAKDSLGNYEQVVVNRRMLSRSKETSQIVVVT
jgi:hypothetical protein